MIVSHSRKLTKVTPNEKYSVILIRYSTTDELRGSRFLGGVPIGSSGCRKSTSLSRSSRGNW